MKNDAHLLVWAGTLTFVIIISVIGCIASMPDRPLCFNGMDYNKPNTSDDDYEFTIGWC